MPAQRQPSSKRHRTRGEILSELSKLYGPRGSSRNAQMRVVYAAMQELPEKDRQLIEWCVEYVVNHVAGMGAGGAFEMVMKMAQLDAVTCDGAGESWIFRCKQESTRA